MGRDRVEDLAQRIRPHAPTLRRLLRALASVGVFTEARPNAFALTPLAALLRTGTPNSMHALAILYGEEHYRVWGNVLHSVKTGETASNAQFGMSYFQVLPQNPDADAVFNQAMTGYTTRLVSAVIEAYDFSPFRTIVDVGGTTEHCLWRSSGTTSSARGPVRSAARGGCRHGASRVGWHGGSLSGSSAGISLLRFRQMVMPICWRRYCIIGVTNAALQSCDIAAGRYQRTGSSW